MLKTGEEDKMNSSSEFQDSLDVVFILNWSPDFHLQITEMLNEIYCVSVSNIQKVSTSCLFLFFFFPNLPPGNVKLWKHKSEICQLSIKMLMRKKCNRKVASGEEAMRQRGKHTFVTSRQWEAIDHGLRCFCTGVLPHGKLASTLVPSSQ